jgi:hypothetical protein
VSPNAQVPWLHRIRASWASLSQIAVWILGLVGSFLLAPPIALSTDDQRTWSSIAKFVVTVLVGLLFVAGRRWNKKKNLRGWSAVATLLLVVAVADFLTYQNFLYSRTCVYNSRRVVTGTVYTPHGIDYVQKHVGISCGDLLEDHVGKAEDVWTVESIGHDRMLLAALYLSCLPLFAACVVAVLQAVAIAHGS